MTPEQWQRANVLFQACLALPEAERTDYLGRECAEQEIRDTVLGMLRNDADDDDRIRSAISDAATELDEFTRKRWNNRRLGAYRIQHQVAAGGMGAIFLAHRNDEQFQRKVAIKLLSTSLFSEEARKRFLAERQILATLTHPNIAELLDGGETEEGTPYLVMEYIDGLPIDAYCDQNTLSTDERLGLFLKVCAAIEYAHQNLVVHRDIKPSNILVTADGTPKLLDFGIAKLLDDSRKPRGDVSAAAETLAEAIMLTPRHASPEQLRGDKVTTSTDIYSLGVLLYQLLSGHFPYDISSLRASEIERIICSTDPDRPSAVIYSDSTTVNGASDPTRIPGDRRTSLPRLGKLLSGDLDNIVLMAMRKEPGCRYATAGELAADIRRHREHLPVTAHPPSQIYRASRFWRRHRPVVTVLGLLLLTVIAGTTASTVGFVRAKVAEQQAIVEARNARQISAFLVALFQEADPNVSAGKERPVRELLDVGLQRARVELADSPEVLAPVLETLAVVYDNLADYPTATVVFEEALALREASSPDEQDKIAGILNALGDLARKNGRAEDAVPLIERALAVVRQEYLKPDAELADIVNNLALAYQEAGRMEDSTPLFLEALAIRQTLYAPPNAHIALSLHNLAYHYNARNELEKAEDYARQAVAMRRAALGEDHPRVAGTAMLLARILRDQGRLGEAETQSRAAIVISRKVHAPGHPDLTYPMYELAMILETRGKLDEADLLMRQVLEWERVTLGALHPDVALDLSALGRIAFQLGRYPEADTLFAEAIACLTNGQSRPGMLENAQLHRGRVLLKLGRIDEAAGIMLPAYTRLQSLSPGRVLARVSDQIRMAELYLARQRTTLASEMLNTALSTLRSEAPSSWDELTDALHLAGQVQLANSDWLAAQASFDEELQLRESRQENSHWQIALARSGLGQSQLASGETATGHNNLTVAYASLVETLGEDHPEARHIATLLGKP